MSSILPAIVAVLGTLSGTLISHLLSRQTSTLQRQLQHEQSLRDERMKVFSEFATLVTDFRRSRNDAWHAEQADPSGEAFARHRDESYRLRASATGAMMRLQLLDESGDLTALAEVALEKTAKIFGGSEEERSERSALAKDALRAFVVHAGQVVRNG